MKNYRNYFDSIPEDAIEIRDKLWVSKDGRFFGIENYFLDGKGKYYEIIPYLNTCKNWSSGYYKFSYNKRCFNVHRLLAEAFIDGYFPGAVADHINGNSADNRLENLQWISTSDNLKKAWNEDRTEEERERHRHTISEAVKKGHAEGKYKEHLEDPNWRPTQRKTK